MNGDLYKNVNSQTMGSESMEGGGVEMGGGLQVLQSRNAVVYISKMLLNRKQMK